MQPLTYKNTEVITTLDFYRLNLIKHLHFAFFRNLSNFNFCIKYNKQKKEKYIYLDRQKTTFIFKGLVKSGKEGEMYYAQIRTEEDSPPQVRELQMLDGIIVKVTLNKMEYNIYMFIDYMLKRNVVPHFLYFIGYGRCYMKKRGRHIMDIESQNEQTRRKMRSIQNKVEKLLEDITDLDEDFYKQKILAYMNRINKIVKRINENPKYYLYFFEIANMPENRIPQLTVQELHDMGTQLQIILTVEALHINNIIHGDLHLGNILHKLVGFNWHYQGDITGLTSEKMIREGVFHYKYHGRDYYIPAKQNIPVIIDFGYSVFIDQTADIELYRIMKSYYPRNVQYEETKLSIIEKAILTDYYCIFENIKHIRYIKEIIKNIMSFVMMTDNAIFKYYCSNYELSAQLQNLENMIKQQNDPEIKKVLERKFRKRVTVLGSMEIYKRIIGQILMVYSKFTKQSRKTFVINQNVYEIADIYNRAIEEIGIKSSGT